MQNEHITAAKSLATNLIETLATQGIDLKRTQALEVISRLQDHSDWNRLSAKLKGRGKQQAKSKDLAAFALLARMGYGKTETMRALFELECADGETCPLLIDVGGYGTAANFGKDPYLSGKDRLALFYDQTGIVHVEKAFTDLCRRPAGKGLVVDLKPLGNDHSLVKFSGVALRQFLDSPAKYVRGAVLKRVGTVFVDEYHRLEDQDIACCEALGRFMKGLTMPRRLVISTQSILTPAASEAIGIPLCHLIPEPELNIFKVKWPWVYRALGLKEKWASQSLDDHRVVSDLFMWSFDYIHRGGRSQPGLSRLGRLPIDVPWFKQLTDEVY